MHCMADTVCQHFAVLALEAYQFSPSDQATLACEEIMWRTSNPEANFPRFRIAALGIDMMSWDFVMSRVAKMPRTP